MSSTADVVVKDSPIHGKGVFAKREFHAGEVVIPWNKDTVRKLTKEELEALPETERSYVTFLESEPRLMLPPARHVNHSCEANTKTTPQGDIALRTIHIDEEITANYETFNKTAWSMVCRCSAPTCKGTIRGRL